MTPYCCLLGCFTQMYLNVLIVRYWPSTGTNVYNMAKGIKIGDKFIIFFSFIELSIHRHCWYVTMYMYVQYEILNWIGKGLPNYCTLERDACNPCNVFHFNWNMSVSCLNNPYHNCWTIFCCASTRWVIACGRGWHVNLLPRETLHAQRTIVQVLWHGL